MLTPLSKYKNQPFAVGSFLEYGQNTKKPNRAEMFDLTFRTVFKNSWLKFISEKNIENYSETYQILKTESKKMDSNARISFSSRFVQF